MLNNNKTNYYCLNAGVGDSWTTGTIGSPSTYNRTYDLGLENDIKLLKESETNNVYKNIGNSAYLKQILWILDNIYIPDTSATASQESNLTQKRELLAKAGIIFDRLPGEDVNGNPLEQYSYRYEPVEGYNYKSELEAKGYDSTTTLDGWYYNDKQGNYHYVELTDDLVEVAQQAALWYFTNYLDNNTAKSETYNVRSQGLELVCSNGTTQTNSLYWKSLKNDTFREETNITDHKADVGKWKQEQANILCWYLIDAANKYAASAESTTANPLTITPAVAEISEKKVSNQDYYVVGPITINEQRTVVYELSDTITVNGSSETGAYISDASGNKETNQKITNYIGKQFYISVPKSKVSANNIKIDFDGTYKTNEKKLWVSTTAAEQPIVEVTPKNEPIELTVTTEIQREFDLALRKAITKVTDKNGKAKYIVNENGDLANRIKPGNTEIEYIAKDINKYGTATYNHRKDPVVVEKGDIVTYTISIYNEGSMAGYAKSIVDRLPAGIVPKAYIQSAPPSVNGEENTGGLFASGLEPITTSDGKYTYTYDATTNEIVFTNIGETVLNAYYDGGDTLSHETIEFECAIMESPDTNSKNKYLSNIAYIAESYNTETNSEVEIDRDSSTSNNPSAEQVTTGDKYTGYHGGDNKNGDNTKDVYNDGTNNDDYFSGREDDDDFEIVVIRPAYFDLALQKHISNIVSPDGTTEEGRKGATIDTTKLADKTATTATYTQDKTPIKVKHGDYVTYTFTVFNEGEVDGYVNKITDNIPVGLQFVYAKDNDGKTVIACDSEGNMKEFEVSEIVYKNITDNNSYWTIDSNGTTPKKDTYNGESTVSITCDVEQYLGTNKLLKAYDSEADANRDGTGLDRTQVTVVLRVDAQDGTGKIIRNEAAITEATDSDGNKQDVSDLKDRDSQTNNWPGKDGDKNYQDDEDYDNIILAKVDLALTKFIAAISDDITFTDGEYLTKDKTAKNAGSSSNEYTRATKVDTTELRDNFECHDATYTRVKTPLTIPEKSYVLYDIRVYNEGEKDVYAGEVADYLPNYLDYVECEFNDKYGWKASSDGKTIKTSYLSYEKDKENNLLKAFDRANDDGAGSGLDYRDLQIIARVNSKAPEATKLINTAEITKYEDENGTEIEKDIDSTPENVEEKNKEQRIEDDDDWEVVQIRKKKVDLALTKFIAAISDDITFTDGEYLTKDKTAKNAGSSSNEYTRATKVDTTELRDNFECHDATYTRVKTPLTIPEKSYVLYDIRVYNEGEKDVYAGEVADYLPNYLDYVECEFNDKYGWKASSDGKTIKTSYLSYEKDKENNLLKAFDRANDDGAGSGLDYRDLQIIARVNSKAPEATKLINTAEITKYEDENGTEIEKDIDSTPENVEEKNKEQRIEDDDDWEVVQIRKVKVDLALSKFIAAVSSDTSIDNGEYLTANKNVGSKENPYIRATKVDTTQLRDDENCHDATYTMVKDPLTVPAQSYVLYDIRVYNEGETDVYAGEVTDHLPDYLDYVDCEFNDKYGWKASSDGKTISTNYLSYEVNKNNLLKAFDKKTDDGEGSGLDYRDLQVIARVNDKAPSNTNIVNVAEITKYQDDGGNDISEDIDSIPDNVDKKNEDDDDYEVILIKTFDLSLIKYVSQVEVTEDGETKIVNTGNTGDKEKDIIPKVEINRKKINTTVVKFIYTIRITNEGDIEGYAKEITDYVPEGLKFYVEDDNKGWTDEGNNIISTRMLEDTLLKPGESAEVKVTFRWINGSSNLGLKRNNAEISEDYNEWGVPDKDSTPDNKVPEEDDFDFADVLLSIKTGLTDNIIMYVTGATIILAVFGVGIGLIKKYVL